MAGDDPNRLDPPGILILPPAGLGQDALLGPLIGLEFIAEILAQEDRADRAFLDIREPELRLRLDAFGRKLRLSRAELAGAAPGPGPGGTPQFFAISPEGVFDSMISAPSS